MDTKKKNKKIKIVYVHEEKTYKYDTPAVKRRGAFQIYSFFFFFPLSALLKTNFDCLILR